MHTVDVKGTVAELEDQLAREGLTDGLPIVPPTVEAVRAMASNVGADVDHLVGLIAPMNGRATVGLLAANAVMAGCRPEHFPVLLAAVSAVMDPAYNLAAVQATTNPVTPVIVVNGPVRQAAGYNSGGNALGQGNRANAVTGRALRLILQNIGGGVPGRVDRATLGFPGKYTFCFAENEERSPWAPLHVERGFEPASSCVTLAGGSGVVNIMGAERVANELIDKIAGSMRLAGSNDYAFAKGSPLLILSPEHAAVLDKGGYTKDSLKQALIEQTRLPWSALTPYNQALARKSRQLNLVADGLLSVVDDPANFLVAVAGGDGVHSCFVMSFGDSMPVTRAVLPP
jgi:hypothetical protein